MLSIKEGITTGKYLDPPVTSVFRGQRQITKQNSTHVCLTGAIPNFIIFDIMKDKLVVNSITEIDPPVTSVFRGQRQITKQNSTHVCLTGAIPNFIIFDIMKDKLVVNSITEI